MAFKNLKTQTIKGKKVGFIRSRSGITSAWLIEDNKARFLYGSGSKSMTIKKVKEMI